MKIFGQNNLENRCNNFVTRTKDNTITAFFAGLPKGPKIFQNNFQTNCFQMKFLLVHE